MKQTRRGFLKTTAMSALAFSLPTFWRTTDAKPKLHLALWNHWVKEANPTSLRLIDDWSKKNSVDVKVDFVAYNDTLTKAAAAARAGVGPDVIALGGLEPGLYVDKLAACNEVTERLQKKYGKYYAVAEYTLKHDGKWIGVPTCIGNQTQPLCARISIFKKHCGVDFTELFPVDRSKRNTKKIKEFWSYNTLLDMAKKLKAAGAPPVGFGLSEAYDSSLWLHPFFMSYGSTAMDAKGEITIESDATLEALEWVIELSKYMPDEVYGWDAASNNRFLIAGNGSAIFNPPSAWNVAKKDNPEVGGDIWHFDNPYGPKGAFRGAHQMSWCLWEYSKNKKPALEIMEFMGEKEQTAQLITASEGFDLPNHKSHADVPIYAEVGPPKGTLYNYVGRGEEEMVAAGLPAPIALATKINTKHLFPVMCAKACSGEMKPKDAIKWAAGQLEDYKAEVG